MTVTCPSYATEAGVAFFASLTKEQIDELEPCTLAHCYIVPGDIVYMPAGCIFCEKPVTAHNLVLRSTTTLLSAHNSQSCTLVAGACDVKILDLIIDSFFCLCHRHSQSHCVTQEYELTILCTVQYKSYFHCTDCTY